MIKDNIHPQAPVLQADGCLNQDRLNITLRREDTFVTKTKTPCLCDVMYIFKGSKKSVFFCTKSIVWYHISLVNLSHLN